MLLPRSLRLFTGVLLILSAAPGRSKGSESRGDSTATNAQAAEGAPSRPNHDSSPPNTYALSKESRFEVKTGKAGALGSFAHNHLIRARSFSGQMTYDEKNPGDSRFEITVLSEGLEVLTAAKPSDKKKIREAMLTKVLKAKEHPEIRFVSRKAEGTQKGVRIEGDLTLVGKTLPVVVDVELNTEGDKLTARGTFAVRQTDFGIRPYSAALGTIKVADQVTFDFEAIGIHY